MSACADPWQGIEAPPWEAVPVSAYDGGQAIPKGAFRLVNAGLMEAREPDWLIEGLIEANTLACVFGEPGAGKTFLTLDIACAVASGTPFHGRTVRQGSAVILAGEAHSGLARRLKAWQKAHAVPLTPECPLYVSNRAAQLIDPLSAAEVLAEVDRIAATSGAPALLVVDTVARNYGSGDENSTRDMTTFVQHLDALRLAYECTVLLVHHTGHADKTRARGSTVLRAALDAEYRIESYSEGHIRLDAAKMKDAPKPEPLAFRLESVELDLNAESGRVVTSAALHASANPHPPLKPAARGQHQQAALRILVELETDIRSDLEARGHDPNNARVEFSAWRDRCCADGVPYKKVYAARDALLDKGHIGFDGTLVWTE